MFRAISIFTMLFFSIAASAQSNNMDKSAVSNIENSVIEINDLAIPFDKLRLAEIDPENYHRSVNLGDSTNAPVQVVSITTSAVKQDNSIISAKKKEVQNSGDSVVSGKSIENKKVVEIVVPATRH